MSMRPNLGYSNYHWIKQDAMKRKPPENVEPEVLEEPKPIEIKLEDEDLIELSSEEEHTDFLEPLVQPLSSLTDKPLPSVVEFVEEPSTKPIEEYTVLELRDLCREKGLTQMGSKEDLLEKIRQAQ